MQANTQNQTAAAGPSASASGSNGTPPPNIIDILSNLIKTHTGEQMSNEQIAHLLIINMDTLEQQGKLTQTQIQELKQFADKHKNPAKTD
ncbi:Transcription initiation factor TFIID subunit 12 [Stygiomarasmius scandens]|uniref:Transcription initiation factor TFIID subunit 12 n=1 Tax=Marasmiellus scandens TaxID=2682957 RepID=A0ABR1JYA0_9AGAR